MHIYGASRVVGVYGERRDVKATLFYIYGGCITVGCVCSVRVYTTFSAISCVSVDKAPRV